MAIHVHRRSGEVAIWTDCEPGHIFSGRCIGVGDTFEEAKRQALDELRGDLVAVEGLGADDAARDDEQRSLLGATDEELERF